MLQEREFERVGGSSPIRVDVRVIAATNRDLDDAVADGTFRARSLLPAQRVPDRDAAAARAAEDIPLLVEYFVHRYAGSSARQIRRISQRDARAARRVRWPGNIRELQNVIERAVIVCDTETLSIDEAVVLPQTAGTPRAPATRQPNTLATRERDGDPDGPRGKPRPRRWTVRRGGTASVPLHDIGIEDQDAGYRQAPLQVGVLGDIALDPAPSRGSLLGVPSMAAPDLLVQHGVAVLFAWAFAVQAGVPAPAVPMLVGAGALSGSGQ